MSLAKPDQVGCTFALLEDCETLVHLVSHTEGQGVGEWVFTQFHTKPLSTQMQVRVYRDAVIEMLLEVGFFKKKVTMKYK